MKNVVRQIRVPLIEGLEMMNMQELDGLTFDSLKEKGEELWEKELQKYRITTDRKTKETFYTSAYHAALHPFVFQDVDGRFRGLDKNIEQAKGFTNYTTFSLWDTYRALYGAQNEAYIKPYAPKSSETFEI